MRAVPVFLILIVMATSLSGQRVPPGRSSRNQSNTMNAEMSIKQAAQQLGAEKKAFERDIEVLRHLRAADEAMTDPMQPTTSVQKAYEEVGAAKALVTDFLVKQGVVRMDEELERARRSPVSADFGRLRSLLESEAVKPAARVAVRNALGLEEETLAWIKVQELIADHLRRLSEISGESLRASQ